MHPTEMLKQLEIEINIFKRSRSNMVVILLDIVFFLKAYGLKKMGVPSSLIYSFVFHLFASHFELNIYNENGKTIVECVEDCKSTTTCHCIAMSSRILPPQGTS